MTDLNIAWDSRTGATIPDPMIGIDPTTPKVLAHQAVLDKGYVELLSVMGSDASIVAAARISVTNPKFTSTDEKLLNYLFTNKHTSPFEQTALKFRVKLPIFVARQWMRHRTWSYNEVSGRYSVLQPEYYVPAEVHINQQSLSNKQGRANALVEDTFSAQGIMLFSMQQSIRSYNQLLERGVAKELARIVLPVSLYTEFVATVDLHNLLHFLELRLDLHAQYEIRVYAEAIVSMVRSYFPTTFQAFEACWQDRSDFADWKASRKDS